MASKELLWNVFVFTELIHKAVTSPVLQLLTLVLHRRTAYM